MSYFQYFDELRKLSRLKLDEYDQILMTYGGINLPFPNGSFDAVISNAVLEHVKDLAHLSNEISRVTRPFGISYHLWHNYYSLSGAHVPDEMTLKHPWGHLLGDPAIEDYLNSSSTYLNRMLPEEIIKCLSNGFHCLAVHSMDKNYNKSQDGPDFRYEGEELFSKEIENKLANYPRSTLLTRCFLFIGVKE
jgi:SAM-dependent methyltransferase